MIKLPPQEKWFQYILGASALFIASVAGLFSVLGIGMLFSGASISAMTMAASLELGKIVATSFLYRYWEKATKFLRVYLSVAILTLIVITSLGVFGWLSSAYQSSAMQYELTKQETAALIEQKAVIGGQVALSKQRIDNLMNIRNDQEKRMNEALNSPVLSRNPTALRQVQEQNISLIKSTDEDLKTEKEHYNTFVKDTMDMDRKILDTKLTSNKTKDVITFKFVADAFGWELNSTVKWFIVLIIVVFDPLAVCLILSYNVVLFADRKNPLSVSDTKNTPPPASEPSSEKQLDIPAPIPTENVATERILLNEVPVQKDEPKVKNDEVAPKPTRQALSTPHNLRDCEVYHAPTR